MASVKDKYDFMPVTWEPFLLRPNLPPEGIAIGDLGLRQGKLASIAQAGQEVGLEFTGKSDRIPNSVQAHALMEYCKEVDNGSKQSDLAEALFKAYFTDGLYPADDNLLTVAQSVGLDRDQAEAVIKSEDKLLAARQRAADWAMRGVSAVPMFYFNGQRVFSGAQEEHTFLRMFEIVAERFPLETSPSSSY